MAVIFKYKNYKHIDRPFKVNSIIQNIKKSDWVISHGFYPFVSYSINFKKYSKEINEETHHHWKIKERPIKYASHIDRYIYQWYSYNLNNLYNKYCIEKGINNSAIAYRTCFKGKTNIEFTKMAFDFIKKSKKCYVMVSDFSKFFDYIEHAKLKNNLCTIIDKKMLPEDLYKVYRSMTIYSYIERDDIQKYLLENNIETEKSIRKNKSFFENIQWNEAKKELKSKIIRNKDVYGIPQGSPLSGVFANIYMINFDVLVNNYVKSHSGLYMRYSDDLIIIIPYNEVSTPNEIWDEIQKIKNEYPYLQMNKDKTSLYLYNEAKVTSLHNEISGLKKSTNSIDFLGFSFDGKKIRFRDKTLTKFHYKLYRKIDSMKKREDIRISKNKKRKTKIDKKQIIKELTGNNGESRKFIDYANHAQRVYSGESEIANFRKKAINKIFKRFDKK